MELTAENTAIVVDSTADFPDAAAALRQLAGRAALRALRRRELPRLRRAARDRLLCAPAQVDGDADDVAADARRLRGRLRGARRLRAHLLAPRCPRSSRGRGRARSSARGSRAGSGSASSTPSRRRSGSRCSRLAVQRRLERGRRTRRSRSSSRRSSGSRARVHGRHARVPRPRRAHRPRAGVGGRAALDQADPHDRRRRDRPGQARAREPEGVRRVPEDVRGANDGSAVAPGGDRARGRARARAGAPQAWSATFAREPRSRRRGCSAPSSAPTPGPGRSASSGGIDP